MLELLSMCVLTGQCSEDMTTPGNGPVIVSYENQPLGNTDLWQPDGENQDLLFSLPRSAHVTSVTLSDEGADVKYNVYYKTDEDADFKPIRDKDGNVKVSS